MFTLKKKRNNRLKIKEIKKESELIALYELRIKTESDLDKVFSSRHTFESFQKILKEGKIWAVLKNGKVIGYTRIIEGVVDLNESFNYIDIENSITLKGTFIDPDYRGQGIQRLLHLKSLRYIKSKKYKKIFSFVHPENIASVKNLRKAGLKTFGFQKGANGTMRMIMIKELINQDY